jgi:SNF2 family DNA or RNA helicase
MTATTADLLEFGSPQQQRWGRAMRAREPKRINLPRLDVWNYGPCENHDEPTPLCQFRKCGGDFFDHQTLSIGWFYMARKGLDASVTGAGKTAIALGTLALCRQRGERIKAIVVCQNSAVLQWDEEAARFAPGLSVVTITSGLRKDQRLQIYAQPWELLIISQNLLLRDIDALEQIGLRQVVTDDVDAILNPENATYKAVRRLTSRAHRVLEFNATSLQTRIQQLWAATSLIGGEEVWGNLDGFENKYIKREKVYFTLRRPDGSPLRDDNGRLQTGSTFGATGYKNLNDFRRRFWPMAIRHTYDTMTDIRLPDIMPAQHVWLDMYPRQREKYRLLQKSIPELLVEKEGQTPQQYAITALAAYTHGQQICTGLPALGEADGPGCSVKLDWLEFCLTGEWSDRKVVVFARNIGTIKALHTRLRRLRIGYATIWGQDTKADSRAGERKRFWEDPNCKVMIGSAAMERSLNLHVSNLLVFLDTIPNPARMTQLIGRIRRAGSMHERVWTFYPLVRDSQEERYMKILGSRQAIIDAVNDEDNADLFQRLSPGELLRLISG